MTSLLVNNSALTALQSLRMTQQSLQQTQTMISTGLAISSAADNAATWSIAQTMQSDQNVYTTLSNNLSESSSMLNVASSAVNSAITVMNSIKADIAQASQPGADLTAISTSLQQLGQQLNSVVSSANFNGLNLLDGSQVSPLNITASYTDGQSLSTATASSIGMIAVNLTALANTAAPAAGPYTGSTPTGTGILQDATGVGSTAATDFTQIGLAGGNADISAANIANTLSNADAAIANLTTYAANLGAVQSRVTSQNNFIQSLNTALTTGVGSLVDADMNQASTRLQALQTQQQLGIQSLSIANQNAQLILKLFQ